MVRGERKVRHRGSREPSRLPARVNHDDTPDPLDPEDDFRRESDDEEQRDPADDEYVWPKVDEEEDD
jgi:hypothetical protein